jgi:hypothetical protein
MPRILMLMGAGRAMLAMLSVAGQAEAQVKYTDERGNSHWVQSEGQVPDWYQGKGTKPDLPTVIQGNGSAIQSLDRVASTLGHSNNTTTRGPALTQSPPAAAARIEDRERRIHHDPFFKTGATKADASIKAAEAEPGYKRGSLG